ncbi:MAG: TlpA family protein disulfide reductase [Janthinobacterium lividum]
MKPVYFLLLFLGIALTACSQDAPLNKDIPPYHILTSDSVYETPANLKKNIPVMIMYFAPDCPHCQHMTMEITKHIKEFGNTQIVMISFVEPTRQFKALTKFVQDYQLKKYPNIKVGTEGYTYVVQKFYQVRNTPYFAVYDKNHKLVETFAKIPEVKDLVKAVKN